MKISFPKSTAALLAFLLAALTGYLQAQTADDFDPHLIGVIPGPTDTPPDVKGLAVQPDGRFLVGGLFNKINGAILFNLARFQSNGGLESAFKPFVRWQADRVGILPGGQILTMDEQNAPYFFRYLPGGAADPAFVIPPGTLGGPPTAMVLQQDGGVVFCQSQGPQQYIRRLFPNGSPDNAFDVLADGSVTVLAMQRDGKILVGGFFTELAGTHRAGIGRLNSNGSLNMAFDPQADWGGNPGWIESMAVQGDGKIIVTGGFDRLGGKPNDGIARLNPNGTSDAGFTASLPAAPGGWANSIAIQADGKIIIGGAFDALGGSTAKLGRLNTDGSLDTSFNPAPDGEVTTLALDATGRLLVGGYFMHVGGQARAGMARLLSTGPATESLSYDGTAITWLRGGTSPDVWATTFELSADGSTWTSLGDGTPIAGGWQLTGISAPVGSRIRTRGFIASGYANASRGMVESTLEVSFRILAGSLTTQPFGFTLFGPVGQSVVIECTTNLQNWIPLKTNVVPGNGLVPFTDPDSTQHPQRFYRGRVQ